MNCMPRAMASHWRVVTDLHFQVTLANTLEGGAEWVQGEQLKEGPGERQPRAG